jgi:hypothetical protein
VQSTGVDPCVNIDPDWRVQLNSMGATPPLVEGAANATATPDTVVADALTLAGHEIVNGELTGGAGGGGDGAVGVSPHPHRHTIASASSARSCSFILGAKRQFYPGVNA